MPDYEPNHPMIRGRRVHEEIEHYIAGTTDDFPSSGKKLKDEFEFCREMFSEGKATVEEQWGFDEDWSPVGWFDDKVWCRMATDAFVTMDDAAGIIYDWKTGKSFGNEVKYMQQMQLYAVGAFLRYPDLERCTVHLGFVDDGKLRSKDFERGRKINTLLQRFSERGGRMVGCTDFRPKPNAMNCKYCPFGPNGTKACIYGAEGL